MNEREYKHTICALAIYKDVLGKEEERQNILKLANWIHHLKDLSYIQFCKYTPYFSAFDSYEDTLYSVNSFWHAINSGRYKNYPTFNNYQESGAIEDTVYKFGKGIEQLVSDIRQTETTVEDIANTIHLLLHS